MDAKEDEVGKDYVKWFSKVNLELFGSVGEKGASLGELYNNHFPVPNGFIVTTESYNSFLKFSNLEGKIKELLEQIDFEKNEQVEKVCSKIKDLIMGAEFPEEMKEEIIESYENLGTNKLDIEKGSAYDILNNANESVFVSVRASLIQSEFMQEIREQNTYLNVKGNENLLSHIKSCFASLFNPDTIKRELAILNIEDLKIAVVVQQMIESEKSGIIYSSDSQKNIVINAIWGLGEGMNLKEISPDRYILSRGLDLLDKKIEKKEFMVVRDSAGELRKKKTSEERSASQILNKYEMQRLGDFAQKIEEHFKSPQKIEFGIDGGEIYVLQTRKLNKLKSFPVAKTSDPQVGPEETKEQMPEPVPDQVGLKEGVHQGGASPLNTKNGSKISPVEKITKTKLKLMIDSPNLIDESLKTGLKKVGILKIEKMIKENGKHPFYFLDSNYINEYENLIYNGIKKVKDNFEEVWVRTSNFESGEFSKLEGAREVKEKNPFLGLRGIRFGLKYLDLLESELNAAKRISENSSVGVLIPNIISMNELNEVKKKLDPSLKLGISIETPAAVQLIKDFCEEVNFVLIDGDNLLQNILSVDNFNSDVKELFDYSHPAFLYQLEYMIRVCKRNNVAVSLFGNALHNPEILKYLVEKGIDFVCVSPAQAGKISEKISKIEEDVLKGTDKEPRQYELSKEKKEYIAPAPKEEFKEKVKIEGLAPVTGKNLEEDIKLIEEEKQEYTKSNEGNEKASNEGKENEEEKLENFEQEAPKEGVHQQIRSKRGGVSLLNVENGGKELKEDSKEEFDEEVEDIEEELVSEPVDPKEEVSQNDENLGENQDENEELVEEEFVEEEIIGETKENASDGNKKDTLGLFE